MARQEVVISNLAGMIQGYVLAHLVSETRDRAIQSAVVYRHKQEAHDTLPFLCVYSDERARTEAGIGSDEAFPEGELKFAHVERIIVLEDSNPEMKPGERLVKAVVLVRKHYLPSARRLLVKATWHIASNGNVSPIPGQTEVRDLQQPNPDDVEAVKFLEAI